MGLIKSANSTDFARNAVVLDLGDLYRQGQTMLAEAERRAAGVRDAGEAERARLIGDAAAVGHAAGFAEGRAEGVEAGTREGREAGLVEHRAGLLKLEAAWVAALDSFLEERSRLMAEAKIEVVALAAAIATAVIKKQVEMDASIAAAQLEQVLAAVMRPSRLVVCIHPDDRDSIGGSLPTLLTRFDAVEHVELVEDASIGRGSCVARLGEPTRGAGAAALTTSVGGGEIDASIRTQTMRIVELLLPGRVARADSASPAITPPTPPGPMSHPPDGAEGGS